MKRLGYYQEFWPGSSVSVVADVGQLDDVTRRRAGIYLNLGVPAISTMERLPDVIDHEEVFLTGGLRTDGDWYWRADLAHYVLKHALALPDEFLSHATANQWLPPMIGSAELKNLAQVVRVHSAGA